jgi:hypothetical protein
MINITPKLTQTAYKVSTSRNQYGDSVWGATGSAIPCLYRDISTLGQSSGNREEVTLDGLFWLDNDQTVNKADIYKIGTEYIRIERVVEARDRLRGNAVAFIKCEVTKQRQIS